MQGIKVIVEAVDRVTAPIRRISGSLRAINLAPLREQLGRVVSAAKAAAGEIARTVRNVAIGISGLAVGVGAMMLNVMRRSNEAAVAAERVGISAQSFQGIGYAAQREGAEVADMADALKDLNLKVLEAVNGNEDLRSGFRRMGVDLRDAQGNLRPTEDIFIDLADAFAAVPDGAKKSAAAIALMGEAGLKMIPMLNRGSNSLRETMEEAERLGLVLDEETAAAFKAMSLDLIRLQAASTGLQNTIASKLLPVVQPLVQAFTDWIVTNRELIATNVLAWMEELPGLFERATETALAWRDALEPVTATIGAIVEQLGPMNASLAFLSIIVAGKLIPVFLPLIRLTWLLSRGLVALGVALGRLAFGPLVAGLGRMFTAMRAGTGVMAAFNAVMLANPIGLVVAAVAALAGSAYLVYRNWEDVGPWFGRLWKSVERSFNGVVEFIAGVFTLDFQRAFDGLKEIVSGWKDWIVTIWSGVYGAFRAFVNWLDGTFGTQFGETLSKIEGLVVDVVGKLGDVWGPIKAAWDSVSAWVRDTFAPAMQSAVQYVSELIKPIIDAIAASIKAIGAGIDTVIDGAKRAGEAVDRAGAAVRSSLPSNSALPEPLAPVRDVANSRNPAAAVGAAAGAGRPASPDRSLGPRSQAPDVPTVFGPGGSPAPGSAGNQVAQKVDTGGTLRIELDDKLRLASARMNDSRTDVTAGQSLAMS